MRAAAVGEELHRGPSLLVSALELRRAPGHANILLAIEDITERRHATEGIGGSQPAGSRNHYGRHHSRANAMVFAGAAPALPPTARRAIRGRQPHNTAVLLPRRARFSRGSCHRDYARISQRVLITEAVDGNLARPRPLDRPERGREWRAVTPRGFATEARYWAPFLKRSEPMRSDGCRLNSSRFDASAGMHAPQSWPSSIAAWQHRAPALCRCLGHRSSRSRERTEPRPIAARFVLPTRPVLGHAGPNLPPLLLLIFVERAQRQ